MSIWVLENNVYGVKDALTPLYKADRETMEQVLAIQQKCLRDTRLRNVTAEEWSQRQAKGYSYIELGPECKDWFFQTSFDGESWSTIYRDTSLTELLNWAQEQSDGHSHVFFRPATAQEIAEDEADRQDAERENQKQLQKRLRYGKIGGWTQVAMTLALAYEGIRIVNNHAIVALCLLALAGISGLNLLWGTITWVIYRISFTIGRGLRDGKQ